MPILIAFILLLLAGAPAASARTVEIGTAINNGGFASGGQAYRDALLRYDAFTAESAMKMVELQPTRGMFNFARADSMVSWARANGRKVHGHNLIWCADQYTPAWVVNGSWTRSSLLAVMQDHIRRVMARWKGQIASWDVVNEAIAADGSMRDCVWRRVIGPDWVEQAFRTARAADPVAKLYLNEFGADTPNAAFAGTEALARDFKARGVPLDGIGLQYHVYGRQPFQYVTEEVLRRVGALGLTAHISELDSTTSPLGGTVAEKLARQGQAFQTIASACQAVPACTRVTTWGVSDAWSWRGPAEMAVALDGSYAAKPAWEGLVRELRPAAIAVGSPGQPGTVRTGVKYDRGTYLVSWEAALDAQGDPLTYRVEHMDANDTAYSPVATGIRELDYRFSSDGFIEQQGTWRYRVRASDPTGSGAWKNYSGQVVVDRVSPRAARLVTDRAPAWQDWYRDGVEVRFTDGGDPALPDGSPGSGLDPASVPPPQLIATTGSTVVSGAGEDRSGNPAPAVSGTYRVDADAPVASASTGSYQPGTWTRSSVTVTFACSDAGSGLTGPVPAPVVVSGEGAGQLRSADCADRVGHVTTATSGAISIDKSAPAGSASCPAEVTVGSAASASWTASDPLSGVSGAASGTISLDTTRVGTFTAGRTVADNAGNTATLSCGYRVIEAAAPQATPTATPAATPTPTPTPIATATPTVTASPTATPTATPVASAAPTATPTVSPTATPTTAPTSSPPRITTSSAPATRTAGPSAGVLGSSIASPQSTIAVKPRPVKGGRLRLALACGAAACDGRLDLGRGRSHRFALAAGERKVLAIRLTRRERRALARRGKLTLRITVRLAGATDARRLVVTSA